MVRPRPTVVAGVVQRVVDHALRAGVRPDAMRRATGVPLALAEDAARRVVFDHLLDLWTYLGQTLDDPSLPIRVAQQAVIEDLHVLGFAMMTAPSVRDALDTVARYGALLTDSGRWEVTEAARRVHVRWYRTGPLTLGHRLSNETAVAQGLGGLRRIAGADLTPVEVTFRHPAPPRRAGHSAFFGCAVRFDAPHDGFSFRREILDAAPPSANRVLWEYLCRSAEALSEPLTPRSIVDAVRHQIVRELSRVDGGIPSLSLVACALGTTERTLRRRLDAEGTSFRRLVEEVRRERASDLLRGATASVTEIALQLGFADTTAFSHACQRWFGRAPRELRSCLRATPEPRPPSPRG
ncbi:AraC family transcriptional regulator [Sorangium cellulosum]|uniref:AraC family transcriptional regulator n=1 Tax=Sorangium cellulosum TaxID=56 RepID=A0A150QD70_SORCE|nr:AraC family transcriptional regulator [Sorangium cellulosum]KYF65910.1 AraC family transcriptional regulator [Sorangium cellulosum]